MHSIKENSRNLYDQNKIKVLEQEVEDFSRKIEKISFQLEILATNFDRTNKKAQEDLVNRQSYEKICIQNHKDINAILANTGAIRNTLDIHSDLHKEYASQIFGIKDVFTKEIFSLKEQTMREISCLKEINLAQIKVKEGFFKAAGLLPKALAIILSIAASFYAYQDYNGKIFEKEFRKKQQMVDEKILEVLSG